MPRLLHPLLFCVAGCWPDGSKPHDASPTPTVSPSVGLPAAPTVALTVEATASSHALLPLKISAAATWRTLEPNMRVQAIAAPAEPLRWSAPVCELGYALRAVMTMQDVPATPRPSHGLFLGGLVTARPRVEAPGSYELTSALQTGFLSGAIRSAPDEVPANFFASPRITSEGERWQEVDGPTALWSQAHSFPGLYVFFPALPQQVMPGSVTTWKSQLNDPAAIFAVEATRGSAKLPEGALPTTGPPEVREASVELQRWISVGGEPAVELAATWAPERLSNEVLGGRVEVDHRFEGHYVVLASGRLLYAAVLGEIDTTTTNGGETSRQHIRHDHELRLVSACDGPVMPAPVVALSPTERSLAAQVAFGKALLTTDRQQVAALLAPELIVGHGESTVIDLLLRHMQRYGPAAFEVLGSLDLPEKVAEAEGLVTVTSRGSRLSVTVGVDTRGPARVIALQVIDFVDGEQLNLTRERIFSRSAEFVAEPTPSHTVLTTQRSLIAGGRYFMLARRGEDRCAFKLRDLGQKSGGSVRYDWYAESINNAGRFARTGHGSGELSERERGHDHIQCGPIAIRWSSESYVYFEDQGALDLAPTQATTIDVVNPDAPELLWLSSRWGRYAYDYAADRAALARNVRVTAMRVPSRTPATP